VVRPICRPTKLVVVISIIVLGITILLGFACFFYINGPVAVRNAYAGLTLSEMTIIFMEENNGAWPQNWNDLESYYETACRRQSDYCAFEEIRSNLEMDFTFSPEEFGTALREGTEIPELQVIRPKVGRFGWGGWWPNKRIQRYLELRVEKGSE